MLWLVALALPWVVACSDDAGPGSVPRGKTSFGGSYSGPVTGPGSDASLPKPPDGGSVPDSSASPSLDCADASSWDCVCEPDSVAACSCGDSASGTKTCRPSGAGYWPCACVANDKLGAVCSADADCGEGLTCLTATSTQIVGQGPAGGLCTKACAADPTVCASIKPSAKCIGFPDQASTTRFCLEQCDFGDPGTAKASKCHGRVDMGCSPIIIPGLGEAARVCLPNCNSDEDCGTGLFCDPGSGLCSATAPSGDPVGTPCSQSNDTCRGFCEKLDLPATSGSTTLCAERCTAGAIAESKTSCGWNKATATAAPATCIYYPGAVTVPGFGDRGACGQLCDCNADCKATGLVCQPLPTPLDALFKRKGQCSAPVKVDGGTSPGIPVCI
ncbi:MAG: hypothetical protein IPI67_38605 [Myxococcales bacterium]|nr:hypothetical protein [Myxococcales bacterium]